MPFKPRLPKPLETLLRRPPFARPTRTSWAAERARRLAERSAARVEETAGKAAGAAAHSAAEAREKLRAAAREALAKSKFGPARRKAPPPPPRREGLFGRKRAPKPKPVAPLPIGLVETFGFFTLAAVILAWPRPGQRTVLERLTGAPPREAELGPEAQAEARALRDPGRGRDAHSPLEIPARGWREIVVRTWKEFNEDQIASVAGGVTFFSLLAMFPAMAAFVSLYGLFADVQTARDQLRLLAGFLPHDVLHFVGEQMLRIAGGHQGSLGVTFAFGLLLSIWSANGAIKALFNGLNIAYEEKETRGLIRLNLTSLAFTLGGIVFMLLAVAATIVAPVVLGWFGLNAGATWLALLRWPLLLLVLILGLSTLYRYGPSRQHPRWRWITAGGVIAGLLWVVASLGFSFYVANFAHYDRTYGSLGAVIGFMFWMWYSTIIVLFGAELNSELEHQTAVDSTTGAPLPLGARGAAMADTVAPPPEHKPRTSKTHGLRAPLQHGS